MRPEQGPPLSIPLTFFFTGALAMTAAGGLLVGTTGAGMGSLWSGSTIGLVHVGTVGLLLTVMLGALYQLLPVVAGALVPAVSLARLVHLLLVGGAVSLVFAQLTSSPAGFMLAFALVIAALLLFGVPVVLSLWKRGARGPTVRGIELALVGLAAVAALGLRLALGRAGGGYTEHWVAWRHIHAHLGLLCWIGCLIAAVSWQVVPMFYLAPSAPSWLPVATLSGLAVSLLALLGAYAADLPATSVPWAVAPGAAAAWLLQPIWLLSSLRRRLRKRPDPSLRFWALGCGSALAALGAAAAAAWLEDSRWPLVYGFLVLWGWAAAIAHGMLTRIVPFLLWLHRCSPLVGKAPMPSTRELLPDRRVALGWWLHLATLALGLGAILFDQLWAWRALGAGMLATGAHLLAAMGQAVRRAPRPTGG